jgi:hypothetical protein
LVAPVLAQLGASFSFPQDPDYLLLEYDQTAPLLDQTAPAPLLRIYGDGRVRVHRDASYTASGDFELRLSQDELHRILDSLVAKNVARANVAELALARRRAVERRMAEEGTLFAISDDTVTHLALQLESFTPAPGARAIPRLRQRITWANLQLDAERLPELTELGELAAAERELLALLDHPELRRIE